MAGSTDQRVSIVFSDEAYDLLTELCGNRSMSDIIRSALTLEGMVLQHVREGGKILFEKDGAAKEIVLR